MLPSTLTFGQELWLRLVTALGTAVFVTVGAGLVTLIVQRRFDQSKADRERMHEQQRRDAEYERDLAREERALRRELVERASELLGGFYFAAQSYWRQLEHEDIWGKADGAQFDAVYIAWAKSVDVFERTVGAIFGWDSTPAELVHQSRDLLTVRYFDLRGRSTDVLRGNNAKGAGDRLHSGLTAVQLKNMPLILRTHRDCLKSLVAQLLTAKTVEVWPTPSTGSDPAD